MIEPIVMSVLGGAIGGAIGGGVGAAIGSALDRRRRVEADGQPQTRGNAKSLTAIGVVLGLVGGQAGRVLTTPSVEDQLVRTAPIFATLKQYYPAQFATLVSLAKNSRRASSSLEVQTQAQPIIASLVAQHRNVIDEARAAQMGDVLVAESNVLAEKDPQACLDLQNGRPLKVALSSVLPKSIQTQDLTATDAVLKQVATRPAAPATPLPPPEVARLAQSALASLSAEDRTAIAPLVQSGRQPASPAEARAMCRLTANMVQAAEHGPPGTLRQLLASS